MQDAQRVLALDLPSPSTSSTHARLSRMQGQWVVEDAPSRNGTFVNGQRISRAVLQATDILEIGHFILLLRPAMQTPVQAKTDEDSSDLLDVEPGLSTLVPTHAWDFDRFRRVAVSGIPVLVLGETGTGKELFAQALHKISGRPGPFMPVNCGALSQSLFDAQLFGHQKGAFTGANQDQIGFVRASNGGTLFLDEVGDLPLQAQAALLRVLQESEVVPVGAARATKVDVRVVAATHKDLHAEVAARRYRSDLLARLSGYVHRLPPLKERLEDLGHLLAAILRRNDIHNENKAALTPRAGRALLQYAWPNNVRELSQCMATSWVLAGQGPIDYSCLPAEVLTFQGNKSPPSFAPAPLTCAPVSDHPDYLQSVLLQKLEEFQGNISAVARDMGKAPTQIHRWVKKFNIDLARYRAR